MKVLSGLVLVCLAGLLLWGCGGGTTTVTVTSDTAGKEASAEAGELQERLEDELAEEESEGVEASDGGEESGSCDEKGINSGERNEGTCEENGIKWVVANMHTPVKLKTLEASLQDLSERKSIGGEFESSSANGIYVTFTLKVTNLSHAPEEFEEEQAVLFVDESVYTQDFDVQNGPEEKSFLWQGEEIQPRGSIEGTVTFDVPKVVAKKITTEGNLDIANFGAEYYEPEEFFEQEEIGSIRTYK